MMAPPKIGPKSEIANEEQPPPSPPKSLSATAAATLKVPRLDVCSAAKAHRDSYFDLCMCAV